MNAAGIALVKEFEGFAAHAYQDSDGSWRMGYAHGSGVRQGDSCTIDEANTWLLTDLADVEMLVLECLQGIKLTDNELSALVSFTFNVGLGYPGAKDGLKVLKNGKPSTLLTKLRRGDMAGAAEELPKWDKLNGTPCAGLLRRRMAEQALFLQVDT